MLQRQQIFTRLTYGIVDLTTGNPLFTITFSLSPNPPGRNKQFDRTVVRHDIIFQAKGLKWSRASPSARSDLPQPPSQFRPFDLLLLSGSLLRSSEMAIPSRPLKQTETDQNRPARETAEKKQPPATLYRWKRSSWTLTVSDGDRDATVKIPLCRRHDTTSKTKL
ncbi:hypothetical protein GWI33_002379 [Rhynchophorus ferrugineus]|uniref:Uncharacterized protein n=1 Tax=Rhynchophorus ferrugineus TaxID=354439 RepID=A0A834IYJ3_RHYFE|nr:hypothetical protein GWI33_002379 [Rhynchophorus ferrugineus]